MCLKTLHLAMFYIISLSVKGVGINSLTTTNATNIPVVRAGWVCSGVFCLEEPLVWLWTSHTVKLTLRSCMEWPNPLSRRYWHEQPHLSSWGWNTNFHAHWPLPLGIYIPQKSIKIKCTGAVNTLVWQKKNNYAVIW